MYCAQYWRYYQVVGNDIIISINPIFFSYWEARPPTRKATSNSHVRSSQVIRSPSPKSAVSSEVETSIDTNNNDGPLFSEDIMASLKGKPVQLKNAVMMLNEMFPPPRAPQYKVTSQTGPPNNPTFSMVCCIQDQTFAGTLVAWFNCN